MMLTPTPLNLAQSLLTAIGTKLFIYYEDRLPYTPEPMIVVSNHRSFMDAPLLMQALQQPIHIACHHYMGQTPILRDLVEMMGCFPLDKPPHRYSRLFEQTKTLLNARQSMGIFPEGTSPMVQVTDRKTVGVFERGFAHLALRMQLPNLTLLPVAIDSLEETVISPFPLRLLRLFDPSEPLFDRPGFHPVVTYHRVNVLIGRPYRLTSQDYQQYRGSQAKKIAKALTDYCHAEIVALLG